MPSIPWLKMVSLGQAKQSRLGLIKKKDETCGILLANPSWRYKWPAALPKPGLFPHVFFVADEDYLTPCVIF